MLSPEEFTVGSLGDAEPRSLMLQRRRPEEAILIGRLEQHRVAVLLSGQQPFIAFPSDGNHNWKGLIIPEIRIEVDPTSLFDPDRHDAPPGSVIRTDNRLVLRARPEQGGYGEILVTLHGELPAGAALTAGFTKWQVVIGEGPTKRVLWSTENTASPRN